MVYNLLPGDCAIVLPEHAGSAADEELPEIVLMDELILSSTCIGSRAETPHCSRKNYAPKALLTTELAEHAQVLHARATNANVDNSVQVDNASKPDPELIGLSKPVRDLSKDVRVGSVRIIESRSINQEDLFTIRHNAWYYFNLTGTCHN
jgi:hypothetical protein